MMELELTFRSLWSRNNDRRVQATTSTENIVFKPHIGGKSVHWPSKHQMSCVYNRTRHHRRERENPSLRRDRGHPVSDSKRPARLPR